MTRSTKFRKVWISFAANKSTLDLDKRYYRAANIARDPRHSLSEAESYPSCLGESFGLQCANLRLRPKKCLAPETDQRGKIKRRAKKDLSLAYSSSSNPSAGL